jgi:phage FluMu gp28-like protein
MASQTDALIKLTAYQSRWVQDRSRFKIGKWTRQGGKSFATSLEAVLDCYETEAQGGRTKWVFLSAGERQSKELMATAAMHARAIGLAIEEIEGTFKAEDNTEYKQLEIVFPGGSRIIGLPANPSTARGHSAHILLDEFAFHKDSRAIWTALFPTVTRGYKIRIISTPQGRKNKFYELWTAKALQVWDGEAYEHKGERGGYSKHGVDIMQAVGMGLELRNDEGAAIEPEDLRLALNDDEAWHQEYLVEFLDETTAFLPYDLIATVEDPRIMAEPSWVSALIIEAEAHHRPHKSL